MNDLSMALSQEAETACQCFQNLNNLADPIDRCEPDCILKPQYKMLLRLKTLSEQNRDNWPRLIDFIQDLPDESLAYFMLFSSMGLLEEEV